MYKFVFSILAAVPGLIVGANVGASASHTLLSTGGGHMDMSGIPGAFVGMVPGAGLGAFVGYVFGLGVDRLTGSRPSLAGFAWLGLRAAVGAALGAFACLVSNSVVQWVTPIVLFACGCSGALMGCFWNALAEWRANDRSPRS